MPNHHHSRTISSIALSILACGSSLAADPLEEVTVANPIGWIARVFNSQLVKTGDRVSWLENRVATFAQRRDHAMKVDLGYRGFRRKPGAPDPTITLDLGEELPINAVFLVPCQREFLGDTGIFPIRFTIDFSNDPSFEQRTILFASGSTSSFTSDGNPVPFKAHHSARYVRLTVHQGHPKGMLDLFGLSEIVVISGGDTVSFDAIITCGGGSMNVPGIWNPKALTDGRTPLGVWQNESQPTAESADVIAVPTAMDHVSWSIALDPETPVDRVILFPYQLNKSLESLVLSESIGIYLHATESSEEKLVHEWKNPIPGASSMTPLVIPLGGVPAT